MKSAEVFDCKAVAEEFLAWARQDLKQYEFKPALAMVRRGENAGVSAYEKLLLADAHAEGVRASSITVDSEAELLKELDRLNRDEAVHGIMILSPLGLSRPDNEFANAITPSKDIEGRHAENLGYLDQYKRYIDEARGVKCVVPATAKAVFKLLQHYRLPADGAFACIINDSDVVGRPLGTMLKNVGATVVNCHIATPRKTLEAAVQMADIVVTAVPDPAFRLAPSLIRKGAAVVDISYGGNFDYEEAAKRAGIITPAKGGAGVGKVTRAMMFVNLAYCCRRIAVESKAT